MPINWAALTDTAVAPQLRIFAAPFLNNVTPKTAPEDRKVSRATLLDLPAEQRMKVLVHYLCNTIAGIIGTPAESIEPDKGLAELGFDSLMGLELKNRLKLDLESIVSMAMLLDNPSVQELAAIVLETLVQLETEKGAQIAQTFAITTIDIEEGVL